MYADMEHMNSPDHFSSHLLVETQSQKYYNSFTFTSAQTRRNASIHFSQLLKAPLQAALPLLIDPDHVGAREMSVSIYDF